MLAKKRSYYWIDGTCQTGCFVKPHLRSFKTWDISLFLPVLFVVDLTSYAQGRQPLDHALAEFLVLRSTPIFPIAPDFIETCKNWWSYRGARRSLTCEGLGLSGVWGHHSWELLGSSVVPTMHQTSHKNRKQIDAAMRSKTVKPPCRFASLSIGFYETYEAW